MACDGIGAEDAGEVGAGAGLLGPWLKDVEHDAEAARLAGRYDLDVDGLEAPVFQQQSSQGLLAHLKALPFQSGMVAKGDFGDGVDGEGQVHDSSLMGL